MPEELPVDVMPCSNEEYFPPPPSASQLAIMRLANEEVERMRRRFGMSRRAFVRTAAATTIGFWAIDMVMPGRFGNYGFADGSLDACNLDFDGGKGKDSLRNLPGEFIFDVQTHHVDPDGFWRVTNPAIHAFFAAIWPQSHDPGGSLDPIENLNRFHYLKEIFLDSATSAAVLSVVPTAPDTNNPLPIAEASETVDVVNHLADSKRAVMHAFVMPNRGSTGTTNTGQAIPAKPVYFDEEMELMFTRAEQHRDKLRGWKTYCAWGDVPNASGWQLDSDVGMEFLKNVVKVSQKYPEIPPVVATHKGFALPGFDQRGAQPRDVGPAAKANPKVRFLIYHSGYDIGDTQKAYRGDAKANSSSNTVDGLIKSLRENKYDASHFVERGKKFGNVPNVWAELGSVWRSVMDDPDQAAHLLGKLINHVGPKRICWGTDSLWYGSPHKEIVAMRRFEFTDKGKELYGLPWGLEGHRDDPRIRAEDPADSIRNGILGYNAADAYEFDAKAKRNAIACDAVQRLKDEGYVQGHGLGETATLRMNQIPGGRTRRDVLKSLTESPWSP